MKPAGWEQCNNNFKFYRLIRITRPNEYRKRVTETVTKVMVGMAWAVSVVLSSPPVFGVAAYEWVCHSHSNLALANIRQVEKNRQHLVLTNEWNSECYHLNAKCYDGSWHYTLQTWYTCRYSPATFSCGLQIKGFFAAQWFLIFSLVAFFPPILCTFYCYGNIFYVGWQVVNSSRFKPANVTSEYGWNSPPTWHFDAVG